MTTSTNLRCRHLISYDVVDFVGAGELSAALCVLSTSLAALLILKFAVLDPALNYAKRYVYIRCVRSIVNLRIACMSANKTTITRRSPAQFPRAFMQLMPTSQWDLLTL